MPLDFSKSYPKRARLLDKAFYRGIRGYFITFATYNREKYFVDKDVVMSMLKYLEEISKKQNFEVVVYCFMPDHIHLTLTGLKESSDVLYFIKGYKQITGYHFKQNFQKNLWATSFHDHILRGDEDIKGVGRYTLRNPIEDGIVKNILDYPFCGSFIYDLKDLVKDDTFLSGNSGQT